MTHQDFLKLAVAEGKKGMENKIGGPFGAVIVKNGEVIAKGSNRVTSTNDPTAHAEVTVIRLACEKLQDFQLSGCILYSSCEPCPMCLGAIYWARPDKVYYASSKVDAADAGFDDDFIYKELELPHAERSIPFEQDRIKESVTLFDDWKEMEGKTEY